MKPSPPQTLAELTPNERNPRKVTPAKLAALKKALDRFGDLGGVVFNVASGRLVGGHQRRTALGGHCPIVRTKTYAKPTRTGTVAEGYVEVDGEAHRYREVRWDKSTEQAANIAANKGAGVFDQELLGEWLTELAAESFDLNLTMFDKDELSEIESFTPNSDPSDAASDIEMVPDAPSEPQAKRGNLWRLGRHSLMCGDSADLKDIDCLVKDQKVSMVYTDPPYGMRLDTNFEKKQTNNLHSKGCKGRNYSKVIGDHADFDPSVIFSRFADVKEKFLWGADYYCQHLPKEGSWVVWDKRSKADGTAMGNFHGAHFELCWSQAKHQREMCRILWMGLAQGPKEGARVHPTQKPVDLAVWFFSRWGKTGDVVVDLYGGSGSTLLACEKAERTCLMMELDPGYCDVIIARWEKLTGQKAELVNS